MPSPDRPQVSVRAAAARDVGGVADAYKWLFAPPGSRPAAWDVQVAGIRLSRTDAHRFYDRHDPAGRSLCFSWLV